MLKPQLKPKKFKFVERDSKRTSKHNKHQTQLHSAIQRHLGLNRALRRHIRTNRRGF